MIGRKCHGDGWGPATVEELDALARTSLEQHPDAIVASISAEGLRVDMPDSLPLTRHAVSGARSAFVPRASG